MNLDLFPEMEGFMMVLHDQVVSTRKYMKHIAEDPTPGRHMQEI